MKWEKKGQINVDEVRYNVTREDSLHSLHTQCGSPKLSHSVQCPSQNKRITKQKNNVMCLYM